MHVHTTESNMKKERLEGASNRSPNLRFSSLPLFTLVYTVQPLTLIIDLVLLLEDLIDLLLTKHSF